MKWISTDALQVHISIQHIYDGVINSHVLVATHQYNVCTMDKCSYACVGNGMIKNPTVDMGDSQSTTK
jgi:hypothetical protein